MNNKDLYLKYKKKYLILKEQVGGNKKGFCTKWDCERGQTITKCYRRASLKHHPDRGGDEEKMKELNNAYTDIGEELRNTPCFEEEPEERKEEPEERKEEPEEERKPTQPGDMLNFVERCVDHIRDEQDQINFYIKYLINLKDNSTILKYYSESGKEWKDILRIISIDENVITIDIDGKGIGSIEVNRLYVSRNTCNKILKVYNDEEKRLRFKNIFGMYRLFVSKWGKNIDNELEDSEKEFIEFYKKYMFKKKKKDKVVFDFVYYNKERNDFQFINYEYGISINEDFETFNINGAMSDAFNQDNQNKPITRLFMSAEQFNIIKLRAFYGNNYKKLREEYNNYYEECRKRRPNKEYCYGEESKTG